MTLAQEFARRLRQERRRKAFEEEADISWEDVATAVELSGAAISRYVKGRLIPDDVILQRLADYFGVRRVWLRYGEGERTVRPVERAIDVVEQGVRQQDPADIPPETRRVVGQRGKSGRGR